MNSRRALILSIGLNVVLAVAVGWLWSSKPPKLEKPAASALAPESAGTQVVAKTNVALTRTTNAVTFDWRRVESENYRQYIANLRGIGCPEETIRDIIIADVNKLFESRSKELFPATNKFEYWKGGNIFASLFDEKKMQRQQELNAEKRALLKELLGVDVPDKADIISGTQTFETLLDFLPNEKRTELLELEQKFAAKMAGSMKEIQRGDLEALKKLQAEKDAEMLKILSPEEKFEYDLRMSQTAMLMRMQMGEAELTEQEFRDVFKLRKEFDDEFSIFGMPPNTPEGREQRTAAQKELDGQIRQALGEDRFLEYRFSGDFERSSLNKIAQEHNVPRESALRVYEIRDVAQAEAALVRQDTALTPEQRQGKLDEIQRMTAQEIGNLIGPAARDAYLEKGSWLKNLNRGR